MISITWIVSLNNIVSILAAICCFIHALHGGIHTSNMTKLVLFSLGLVFFSTTIDVADVVLPGYKYILFANILFCSMSIGFFVLEAKRFGFTQLWYESIRNLLHIGDRTNATKK